MIEIYQPKQLEELTNEIFLLTEFKLHSQFNLKIPHFKAYINALTLEGKSLDWRLGVYQIDNIPISFAFCWEFKKGYWYLHDIYCLNSYRKCGIGLKVLDAMLDCLKKVSAIELSCDVMPTNLIARQFFKQKGFYSVTTMGMVMTIK